MEYDPKEADVLIGKVASIVRRSFPYWSYEDLRAYGWIGFLKAVKSFDPKYEVPFSAWASMRVRTEMIDSMRRWTWVDCRKRDQGEWHKTDLDPRIPAHEGFESRVHECLMDARRIAPEIPWERFLAGDTLEEVGKLMGIKRSFMCKKVKKVARVLQGGVV